MLFIGYVNTVYKAAVTDFISFKMCDSYRYARLHILSWILTHFFKKEVTVTAFTQERKTEIVTDGYIDIRFDALLTTDRELLSEVLHIIRETLAQGRFVSECEFCVGIDESLPFDWSEVSNDELPFEWSCYLPETSTEDMLRCKCCRRVDDGSIAAVFTLTYSITMDRKACFDDDSPKNSAPHLEQLRRDVEILWGKNRQQTETDKICESLQGMRPYETDLFASGQDTFISASIVRAFKEKEDLCTGLVETLDYYYRMSCIECHEG